MAGGTFGKRMAELRRETPARLTGEVIRDQPYAQYQHEELGLRHPNGGQAKYQEEAILGNAGKYVGRVAEALLDGDTVDAMEESMVDLGEDSGKLTPKDLEILVNSDRKRVLVDGQVVRDIPPLAARVDPDDQLDMRQRAGVAGRWAYETGPNRKPPADTTGADRAPAGPRPRPVRNQGRG